MPKVQTDDGVHIHYHLDDFRDPWAAKPEDAIFMFHGFARSIKWWTQWVPALARQYRVVRMDCRGCGESSVPPQGAVWSAERFAKDALQVIDALGLRKIHWVGFESGGLWGIMFAVNHPERIKSLTIMNTPRGAPKPMRPPYAAEGYTTMSESIRGLGFKQWLVTTNSRRMDLSLAPSGLMEWHLAEHSKTSTQTAASIANIYENLDVPSLLPKIKAPTLIMIGDRSPTSPLTDQHRMQQDIPNARLAIIPNIAAGIQLLIPEQCAGEVLRFINSL